MALQYEKLFRSIFQTDTRGILLISPKGSIVEANPAFLRILDIDPSKTLPEHFSSFVHSDDAPFFFNHLAEAIKQQETSLFASVRLIPAYSKPILAHLHFHFIYDDDDEATHILISVTDFSKQLELMKSEELFRHLYEESPIAIVLSTTNDRKFAQANKQFCELVGYSLQELQKLYIDDITHPDDVGIHLEEYNRLMRDEMPSFNYQKRYLRKDGQIIWAQVFISSLHDTAGKIFQSIAMVQDITEQRQAQSEILESEHRFRTFFDQSPLAIGIRDFETNELLLVNDKLCNLMGYSRDELIGQSRYLINHSEDEDNYNRLMKKLLSGAINSFQTVKAYRKKDGTVIWCESTRSKVYINNRLYISATIQDITEKRKAEHEKQSMTQVLKNLIAFLPIVYYRIDADGVITESIGSGLRKLGLKDRQNVGKNIFDLYGDSPKVQEAHRTALAGGYMSYETHLNIPHTLYYNTIVFFDQANGKGAIGLAFDITESKNAMFALQESEDRYKTIFEVTEEGMVLADIQQKKILECNQAILTILEASREDVMNASPLDFCPEFQPDGTSSRTKYLSILKKAAREKNPISFEWRQITKKGREFDAEVTVCPINKGNQQLWLSITRDITEQKRAEIEKQRIFEEQQYIFDAMPLQFYLKDAHNNILRCNQKAAELLKVTAHEMRNVNAADLTPEFATDYLKNDLEVFRTKKAKLGIIEKTMTADGFIWVSTDKVPYFDNDGNVIGVLVFTKDVTELYEAQEALQLSEAKYRDIFESVNDSIVMTDAYANVIEGNHSAKELFELDNWHIINIMDIIHADNREKTAEYLQKLRETGQYTGFQTRIITKSGKVKHIEINSSAILDEENTFIGSKDIIRDITDRMQAQQELEASNRYLKKVNTELDHFVYRASHDLRAPLSSLLGLIDVIKMHENGELTLDLLDKMGRQINKLEDFIKEIIDYSRVSRTGLNIESIDLKKMILEILDDLCFMDNAEKIKTSLTFNQEQFIYTDKRNLDIILNNLLSNAIKYADLTKDSYIHIEINIHKSVIEMSIKDNGIGIREEFQLQIFDMFFRATDKSIGSGLGLFIVKEAIQKINGSITVESTFGQGSIFNLKFPNLEHTTEAAEKNT